MDQQISEYLSIIQEGLQPKAAKPQKIVVVGAGMAGLVAAYELLRAGHEPLILEARQRVGGRIYTLREPFTSGLYAEAGAMRIPKAHRLTMAYIEKWGLPVFPFTMDNPAAFCYLRGYRYRVAEADADPDRLGFAVAERERGKTVRQLWRESIRPIVQRLQAEGEAAWLEIVAQYDRYSLRGFLEANRWSEGAIEMFGLLFNQEPLLNNAFLPLLREELDRCYTDLVQIVGGTDRLPRAFLPALPDRIRFGAKVTAIDQATDSVTVYYQTLAGSCQAVGDYAILTVPFPALAHIEVLKPFSEAKKRAIRQLHYDAATKIFLQCRRRFWEEDDGIVGGATITDLPIRNIYYPEHGRETGRGVLLTGYTWGDDALRWGSLSAPERVAEAIKNVARIHPQIGVEFETGASVAWQQDEFAGGSFALFNPGQQTLLYEHIVAPEGRVYFAGEHASLAQAWVQGAIESGLRAARDIHQARR